MKASARNALDGYAVQNTANVLHALRAYFLKAEKSSRTEAEQSAIESYAALCKKRVTTRTVRKWLGVVKTYGGIENVPSNAFGALKACTHIQRPVRAQARQMDGEIERLLRETAKQEAPDPGVAVEIAFIERDVAACVSRVEHDAIRMPLESIRRLSRRLGNMPVHRLHKFVPPSELEGAMTGFLARLRAVAINRTGKAV